MLILLTTLPRAFRSAWNSLQINQGCRHHYILTCLVFDFPNKTQSVCEIPQAAKGFTQKITWIFEVFT
jgi:hypothetical protein